MCLTAKAADRATALGIPLILMSATNQGLARAVADRCTLQRQYEPRRFRGQREYFAFLLDHMDACSVLSEQAGLINYRVRAAADGEYYADDKEDAAGTLLQIACTESQRVYFVEGAQRGTFTARGSGVVLVNFRQVTPEEIEYTGRLYVRVDNPVAATLAKVFFIFVRNSVDRHFDHLLLQPIGLTQLATDSPAHLQTLMGRMPAEDYRLLAPFDRLLRPAAEFP